MPQHGDTLVYNAESGQWQNASMPGPDGNAVPVTSGPDGGSQAMLHPLVGKTIRRASDGKIATINSALILSSGGNTELLPAAVCTVVYHPGAPNEQISTFILGAWSKGTAGGTAIQLIGEAADASSGSAANAGYLSTGGAYGTDYNYVAAASIL